MKDKIIEYLAERQLVEDSGFIRGEKYKGFGVNDDDCPAYRYDDLSGDLNVSRDKLKKIMIELRNDGLVQLLPTVDSDYKPHGSGWFITDKGMRFAVDNDLLGDLTSTINTKNN